MIVFAFVFLMLFVGTIAVVVTVSSMLGGMGRGAKKGGMIEER